MEYLSHRHRKERHRHTVSAVCDLPVTCFHKVTDKVRGNGEDGNENALICYINAHTVREDTCLCITGLAAHDVGLCLLCSERERREAVGYEIYPKEVYGLENGKSE